jgi:SAM-dependent methyltransferase
MNEKSEWDLYWKHLDWKRKIIEYVRKMYFSKIFVKLIRKFCDNGFILEAGCGSGDMFKHLDRRHYYVGLDYSLYALKNSNVFNPILGDIGSLPFKNKAFDIIYNQGVMEHFSEEEWGQILREFKRVSDQVLILVPSITSIFRIISPFGDIKENFFSKTQLRNLLGRLYRQINVGYIFRSLFLSIYCFGKSVEK